MFLLRYNQVTVNSKGVLFMNYELDGLQGARLKCTLVLWLSEETSSLHWCTDSFRQCELTVRNAAAARADLQVGRCGSEVEERHKQYSCCPTSHRQHVYMFRKQHFRLQK